MTLRERILSVYRGERPDVVPYMLDLSHYYYHRFREPWDLSQSYPEPEKGLIDYHRRMGVGFYIANLAPFYSARYGDDVTATTSREVRGGVPEITWELSTPLGSIRRTRVWEERSYSWTIPQWGVRTEQDLRVLGCGLGSRSFEPAWDCWHAWNDYVGDCGVVYIGAGYSAMGYLLSLWMGVVGTTYAICDWPDTVEEVVAQINDNTLRLIDLLAESPAEVIIVGDNFSSDIQPPHFVERWSRGFYEEAFARLHRAGKYVAVHADGKLHGMLRLLAEMDADCADAVSPGPVGGLTAAQCREEAGERLILSGGVSPELWLPSASIEDFRAAVLEWLSTTRVSHRLLAGAGDQVPPGAEERRIEIMRELVEEHGRL
ncbi:MAG: uroporphyrinogen decarboxylase family protein [Armatimonadota bacterium]